MNFIGISEGKKTLPEAKSVFEPFSFGLTSSAAGLTISIGVTSGLATSISGLLVSGFAFAPFSSSTSSSSSCSQCLTHFSLSPMKSNAIVLQLLDNAMPKLANKTYPQILDQAEKTCQRHIIEYFMKRKYAIVSGKSFVFLAWSRICG
jgi:hypothetical protein